MSNTEKYGHFILNNIPNNTLIDHKYKDWDNSFSDNTNRYIDSLKVFYLNPETSEKRRKTIKEQFFLSGIKDNQIERIEPTKYPSFADSSLKNNIISWDHINMWQKAYEQNCDGALFFEDDIYFLKNWKQIVQNIFDINGRDKTHIIRFDPYPFVSIGNLPDDKISIHNSLTWCCVGGYYMSKDAIITSLNYVKTNPWKWPTIEDLIKSIVIDHFSEYSYETSPRICIQNWFLNNVSSAIQSEKHLQHLKNRIYDYLKIHKHKYMFNNTDIDIINKELINH
jgi:hypothetical protein